MKLRKYQEISLQEVRKALMQGYTRVLLSLPTGGGKTVIAATIIQAYNNINKRVWFICDNTELVSQTVETLKEFGIDAGVIQGQHEKTDYSKNIQVCTPQTLTRRWARFDQNKHWLPDFIIIDEAHVIYKGHRELFGMLPNTKAVGLSATPYAKNMAEIYQKLVSGTSTQDLVEEGYLSQSRVYSANIPDLKTVKKKSTGDWQEDALAKAYNNKTITGDIVKTWFKLARERKTIVFCITVQHSIDVANAFADQGINTAHLDGYTHKGLRDSIIDDYKNGDTQIICNVGVLTKGFDAPDTSCLVLARPTKSKMLHFQCCGRGLRIADNKNDCLILDHAGNIQRLGFPEDNIPDTLCEGNEGNKKDRNEKPIDTKVCPTCKQTLKVTAKYCGCGHEFEFKEKEAGIVIEPGELKELKKRLTPSQIKHIQDNSGKRQQEFYSGMIQHGLDKGYKDGYAFYKFREYFGMDVPAEFHDNPMPKNIIVQKYVNYLNIKAGYAGRKYK